MWSVLAWEHSTAKQHRASRHQPSTNDLLITFRPVLLSYTSKSVVTSDLPLEHNENMLVLWQCHVFTGKLSNLDLIISGLVPVDKVEIKAMVLVITCLIKALKTPAFRRSNPFFHSHNHFLRAFPAWSSKECFQPLQDSFYRICKIKLGRATSPDKSRHLIGDAPWADFQ